MKNTNLIITALVALVALQFIYIISSGSSGAMKREYKGDVVAKVNGDPIKEEEVRERLDFITGGKGASINFNNIDEKGLEALAKEVYVQRLVLDKAMDSDIQNDPELKNKVASLVNTIYKEKFLEKIANKEITDEKVQQTYNDLVAKAKNSKQYKVRHILVKSEKEAKDARDKIVSGSASFQDIAKLDSIDKGSAIKGGDLGYIFPEEFVKEFADEVKRLPKGQISDPVKTEFGWHIIKVEDSKNAEIVSFEDAKPRIEKQIGAEAVRKYVDSISKDVEIKVVKKPEENTDVAPAAGKASPATPAAKPANTGTPEKK